jgi:hypothetical protein
MVCVQAKVEISKTRMVRGRAARDGLSINRSGEFASSFHRR